MRTYTVVNLSTSEEQIFVTESARQAVKAAYAQSLGDWNTWDYDKYDDILEQGDLTVTCGDFCTKRTAVLLKPSLKEAHQHWKDHTRHVVIDVVREAVRRKQHLWDVVDGYPVLTVRGFKYWFDFRRAGKNTIIFATTTKPEEAANGN